jgi:hypothetical protein
MWWPPLVLILSSSGESWWNAISMLLEPNGARCGVKLGAEQGGRGVGAEDLREEKGRGKRRRGKGAKKWRQGRAERGLCRPGGRKAASVTLGREWW